jgi:hypothetical protein
MMSDFPYNYISFRTHYSFWCDFFIPSVFAFFYSVTNKQQGPKKIVIDVVLTNNPLMWTTTLPVNGVLGHPEN